MIGVAMRTLTTRLTSILFICLIALAPASATAQDAEELKPGDHFHDCDVCPEMVVVPPGLFIMGLGGTTPREGPAHRVNIKKPFAIGVYETTFLEWEACVRDGGCSRNPDDHDWGRANRPVINVKFSDVQEYLAWISEKSGKQYRLPSEAEWEYAARAGTTTRFWWGDEAGQSLANCKDCGSEWSAKSTAPVGSFSPNPFGLYDTMGNAFEWTADCWNKTHEGAPGDGTARWTGDCRQRVMRGGSFYYFQKVGRSSYRARNRNEVNSYWLGFRVARDL